MLARAKRVLAKAAEADSLALLACNQLLARLASDPKRDFAVWCALPEAVIRKICSSARLAVQRAEQAAEARAPRSDGLSHAQVEHYVKIGGVVCPSCNSINVEAYQTEVHEGGYAYQNVECKRCNATWKDQFTLDDINDFQQPQDPA